MPAVTRRGRHRGQWALRGADMLTIIAAIALLQVSGGHRRPRLATPARCISLTWTRRWPHRRLSRRARPRTSSGGWPREPRQRSARSRRGWARRSSPLGPSRLPDHRHVTVTVFYTDESMASAGKRDSVQVALGVAAAPLKDARDAQGNAFAEVPYDSHDVQGAREAVTDAERPGTPVRCGVQFGAAHAALRADQVWWVVLQSQHFAWIQDLTPLGGSSGQVSHTAAQAGVAKLADARDLKPSASARGYRERANRGTKSGRVAKLADAAGLKLAHRKRSSGFDSQSGHHLTSVIGRCWVYQHFCRDRARIEDRESYRKGEAERSQKSKG